jgi:hypothetical protein
MASTGNEQGFWVTGTGGQTQIQDWGDGSAHSISAAYNPNARFHVHTHPNNTGPSHADMFASAVLGGMPGLVVAANGGQFAYGFQLEAGQIKRPDGGVLVFQECGATGMCGSDTRIYVTANHVGSSRLPFAHLEIQISSGYDFSVVEGQPEYSINPNLLYKSNGPNNGDAFSYQLTRPSDGRTLNQFARDILNAASRYENNHPYSFPNDVDFLAENEYNSNSFVSGVLSAANTNQVDFANIFHASYLNEKTIPGFENPVPISSAQNSNDDKKGPTEQEIKDHAGAIGNWGDGDVWQFKLKGCLKCRLPWIWVITYFL